MHGIKSTTFKKTIPTTIAHNHKELLPFVSKEVHIHSSHQQSKRTIRLIIREKGCNLEVKESSAGRK